MTNVIVVGGGPSGMFTALILSEHGYNVTLFESHDVVGGCHRVDRDASGAFSEHGPRIYVSNYYNYMTLLTRYDLEFWKHYKPYNHGFVSTGIHTAWRSFTMKDACIFVLKYVLFFLRPTMFRTKSVFDAFSNMSPTALAAFDKMCNLTDGAGMHRYTAESFFNLVNQNIFYKIVEPTQANDKWLWNVLQKRFEKMNGRIVHEHVDAIAEKDDKITGVKCGDVQYEADIVILCTPPLATQRILEASPNRVSQSTSLGDDLAVYARACTYETYVSFTIHFNTTVTMSNVWGGRQDSDWNIGWIVMSDYIDGESPSFISATVYDLDKPSSFTKRTANETIGEHELLQEGTRQIFEQLSIQSETPHRAILNKRVKWSKGRWTTSDMPFMKTPQCKPVSAETLYSNLFWVGPHNMNNTYDFTSLENVCENVIAFCNKFDSTIKIPRRRFLKLNDAIVYVVFTLCIMLAVTIVRRRRL